jgi:hypothetical protein
VLQGCGQSTYTRAGIGSSLQEQVTEISCVFHPHFLKQKLAFEKNGVPGVK